MNDILANLVVCGLLGMTGQGIRAVLGISNAAPSAAQAATQQSVFNASYLVVSLIVGFIAGVLAGLGLGLIGGTVCPGPQPCVTVDPKTLLGLIAAGYAGTDFIENTVAKMLPNLTGVSGGQNPSAQAIGPNPRGGAPSPAPPGADKGPAAPAAAIP